MLKLFQTLFYMGLINAEMQIRKFAVETDTSIVGNGTVIETSLSAIQCASQCLQSTTCCASSFNPQNRTCVTEHFDGFGISKEVANDSVTMVTGIRKHNGSLVKDCSELSLCHRSGVYTVNHKTNVTFEVYCDMETDGGGWTVIQRRTDGITDFYRGWTEYEEGFGDLTKEFWLGNHKINQLTYGGPYKLRVDLEDFEHNTGYALYSSFSVGDAASNYRLDVSGYSGNAGDSLTDTSTFNHRRHPNGMPFSTFDRDNDMYDGNCAELWKGGWWSNACNQANLNGNYLGSGGVNWYHWKGYASLKSTKMMIKRQ